MKCPAIDGMTIIHGDSRRALDCIEKKSVDLVFTSPPYYNAKEYSNWPDYNNYLNDMKTVVHKAATTLKDGHYMIINVSPVIVKHPGQGGRGRMGLGRRIPLHFHFGKMMEDEGMDFIDDIIWEKPIESTPSKRGLNFHMYKNPMIYYPYPNNEHLLVFRKSIGTKAMSTVTSKVPISTRNASKIVEPVEMGETWHIQPSREKDHPATFPEELASRVIKLYSFKDATVLDPFVGSGTTCKVAKDLGRKCIGIEKNDGYARIATSKVR